MEPRIQSAKTEDGVRIAFRTIGEGLPLRPLKGWRSGDSSTTIRRRAPRLLSALLSNSRIGRADEAAEPRFRY